MDLNIDVCLFNEGIQNAPLMLVSFSFGIIVLAAILGHIGSDFPLSQLGNRHNKNGLSSYLIHRATTGIGVKGYDSSLGTFAPPIRLLFHFAGFLLFYGAGILILSLLPMAQVGSKLCWKSEGLLAGFPFDFIVLKDILFSNLFIMHLVVYLIAWMLYTRLTLGVSHPGGPREHKMRRSPKWENKNTRIEDIDTNTDPKIYWRCDVSHESHKITHHQFQEDISECEGKPIFSPAGASGPGNQGVSIKVGLSGEPDGRQIWSWARPKENCKKIKVDENVVDMMALSGRKKGFNPNINPNSSDQIFRAQQIRSYLEAGKEPPNVKETPKTPAEAAKKAVHFFSMLQTEDGHWAGDYGGPHFMVPGLIFTWYLMGKPDLMLDSEHCALIKHYLLVHQQSDGGWGTHIESPSTLFGTVLSYISLRLLGCEVESTACVKGKKFIRDQGGAIMASSWAKFWMCLLGCMEWEGHNSVPPEMFLLPNWFPFHPGRLWCACRMVYLPMGFLYGSRYVYSKAKTDPLINALKEELYCTPYDSIPWGSTRHMIADMDNYSPMPLAMRTLQNLLSLYENWSIFQPIKNFVRAKGLKFAFEYMAAEDLQTNFICIGAINKVLNLVSAFSEYQTISHPIIQNHILRIPDYLWVAEDGMKMQVINGSSCWDSSFAIQAIAECHLLDEFPEVSKKMWAYLERSQILSTDVSKSTPAFLFESPINRARFYRHTSAGGWPFSTSAHGWAVSDTTGESLKGTLALAHSKCVQDAVTDGSLESIGEKRFQDAVNVILTLQNEDGGWSTFENNRGFGWYEQLNPSEIFGDTMVDYSYVECSMASMTALTEFHAIFPAHRSKEIECSIRRGKEFIKSIQRPDGSWYGSWACCFTYGCWFGVEGLVTAGEPIDSPALKLCCKFLLSHQRENGGWGEDFTSCYDKNYAEKGMYSYGDDGSGVVNTAWALLALSCAKTSDINAVKRGVAYLMARQLPSGDWPQQGISGVTNRSVGITYTSYRNVFPIWALGRCIETYGDAISAQK